MILATNFKLRLDSTAFQVRLAQGFNEVYALMFVTGCENWVGSGPPYSKLGPNPELSENSSDCKLDGTACWVRLTQRVTKDHTVNDAKGLMTQFCYLCGSPQSAKSDT